MPSDIIKDNDLGPFDMDFGKEWGDDSILDIEKDLEDLDDLGDPEESGLDVLGDLGDPGESGLNSLPELEGELDEWEEYMDSQWSKIMDE
jgi:hypothetical protein